MAKQKEAWDKLSMLEKALLIKLSVDNGVSSLKLIRDTYNLYANGGNLAHKYGGELVGLSLELVSLAKPTALLVTFSGFEGPLAITQINLDLVQDYVTRFTLEHPDINLSDLLASLSKVPLYEGSLGNGVIAAWMSGKLDLRGNFTHGVAFDKSLNKDLEINLGSTTFFIKAPKNALEHELLGHGARDIALGSTSGSTDREKEIIGNAYPFLLRNVYSHYKENQAQHLLAELLATNTQLRAMLQQNTGLYGEEFDKYVDSMSYEDLYNALYTLNSGYYKNSDLEEFFNYTSEYTEDELNQINQLNSLLLEIKDEGLKYEIIDLLFKLKETLGVKNYNNANKIEAIKEALKTVAYNNINPFEVSNNTYLAAFGGLLDSKKSTGGPLYPFSFEKNPFLKTPAVRYDDGGHLFGFGDWLTNLFSPSDTTITTVSTEPAPLDLGELATRQAYAESRFDSNAVSPAKAIGLFLVTPNTLAYYNSKTGNTFTTQDLYDDTINLLVRDWYMNDLMNRPWNTKNNPSDSVQYAKSLGAYNWGPTNLVDTLNKAKADGVDIYNSWDWLTYLPTETRDYINFVLRNLNNSAHRNNTMYNKSTDKYKSKVSAIKAKK